MNFFKFIGTILSFVASLYPFGLLARLHGIRLRFLAEAAKVRLDSIFTNLVSNRLSVAKSVTKRPLLKLTGH
ncbi:hypothetical protein P9250_22575 [Caballeronia sp. LP006]|uniref:hypothetical protein n=1 Tax=unclassified Caballeronia TaxID=2646786 RepID=UPI0020298A1B|nr:MULTISPECIES: hypothetical protein [unclassified Caballeronia]MDR5830662.1 hypothetical protein [Caballeronia sp. LP006]